MKEYQLIGYSLFQTTAITAIVGNKIYHGLRPDGTATPCINYFELNNTRNYGIESVTYAVNCRAGTSQQARELAREVKDLFGGADGLGIYGIQSSFTVMRSSVVNDAGLVPEPEDDIFNAPIDVQIVYAVSTVS
jgi:hypothetical protein